MPPVVLHRTSITLQSPRAELWKLVADTEKLNRFIGMTPVEVTALKESKTPARYLIRGKFGPTYEDYDEEPYQWQEARFFSFRRVFRGGFIRWIENRYELADEGTGTKMVVQLRLEPRLTIIWPVAWLNSRQFFNRLIAFFRACDAEVTNKTVIPLEAAPANRWAAEKAAEELRKRHDPKLVDQFVEHLCTAADTDIGRIRPFELADQWKRGRPEMLRLCLDGVRAGLTDLNWSLICPSCRGPTAEKLPSLAQLETTSHCQFCDIAFDVELDRAVEATFSPHPLVRTLDLRPYCIGGPRLKPHVVSQAVVEPGHAVQLGAAEVAGRYRLFLQGGTTAIVDVSADAPPKAEVKVDHSRFSPAQVLVGPAGQISVAVEAPGHVKLERTEWAFNAATAVMVSSLPEYREQFGSAGLRPGMVLKAGKLAVLFSDLVGSTALYSRVGDAAAFGIVTDCLDYGRAVVERLGGSVVKTMGDAIMAVFADSSAAVEAAVQTAAGWAEFQKQKPDAAGLEVKLGIAAGPCTIVTANGVLDYFGQTVNTASRVQHLAGPREIVVQAELLEAVPKGARVIERFEAKVKGIDQPLALVRLAPL